MCGLMAPSVHGFMNTVLRTDSPCSNVQMEGERVEDDHFDIAKVKLWLQEFIRLSLFRPFDLFCLGIPPDIENLLLILLVLLNPVLLLKR